MMKKKQEKEAKEVAEKKKQERAAQVKQEVAKRNAEQMEQRRAQKLVEEEALKKKQEEEKIKENNKKQLSGPSEEFLARNETKKKEETITDFNVFRKKHGLTPDIKIFIIRGGYGTLRKALVERGWYENPDKESPVFDFKFAIKSDNPAELKDFQITNHFMKNNVITTKVGLCHSLKNLIWWNNVEVDSFFPMCFDLTDGSELEDFK